MLRPILIVILASIAFYGLIEAWPLLTGPTLSVTSPVEGIPYPSGVVSVSGIAKRAALLSIDDTPVLHDTDGAFATVLTFPRGGSILTFKATDRFGRTVAVTRTLFVP